MNEPQQAYDNARTTIAIIKRDVDELMTQHDDLLDTGSGIDEYYAIEGQAYEQRGMAAGRIALVEAEDALMAWALASVESVATAADFPLLSGLLAKARTHYHTRQRVLALCMTIKAAS